MAANMALKICIASLLQNLHWLHSLYSQVASKMGGLPFIGISIDGIRLSRSLLDSGIEIDFKTYKNCLDRLVVAYFWGVLLVACYAMNIIVWKHSPLSSTANIDLAGAMLTILGIFFVTVPRRFIEHVWSSYCARKNDDDCEHQDILSINKTRIISIIEPLCIAGWLAGGFLQI